MKQLYNFITIKQPPYRWVVREDIKRLINQALIGRETNLQARQVLKDNNARTLFFTTIPFLGEVFVKQYKLNDWWSILKASWWRSQAMNELLMAKYLHNRDVLSVQPLAVLEKKKWGFTVDAFLVLEKINNALTLKDFFSQPLGGTSGPGMFPEMSDYLVRQDILKRLGQLVRQAHQVNFFHKDLHLGNVLLTFSFQPACTTMDIGAGRDEPQLYLIDLHRSLVAGGLSDIRKIYNLAQMSYSINLVCPFTDVIRFLKAYRQFDFRPPVFRKLVRRIAVLMEKFRLRHYASRAKRCLKDSSEFMVYRDDRYKIFMRRGTTPGKIMELIEKHKNFVQQAPGKLFKHSIGRSISVQSWDEEAKIFIKEYRYSFMSRLKNLFRRPAARRSWVAARGLALRRINTPEPLSLVESRPGGVGNSYLFLKEIPDARPANQFVIKFFEKISSPVELIKEKKKFVKQMAEAVRSLHRQGVFHADLKANNILVGVEGGEPLFYFVDLDRVEFLREVKWSQRIKNLAQLNAAMPAALTRADRLRFFNEYSRALPGYEASQKKDLIKRIMKITIARHHLWPRSFGQIS